jgi:nitrogen regulatory protein PII
MVLLKAIIRPEKLEAVQNALERAGADGMTVTEVHGHGKQKGYNVVYRGCAYTVAFLPKIAVEVIIDDGLADDIVQAIMGAARTGQGGDGRIFAVPVTESYAIRMSGLLTR